MSLLLFAGAFSEVSSEEVLVLLLRVVEVIVPVIVVVLLGIVSVILPVRAGMQLLSMSPSFELQVRDRASLVVIRDSHCAAVSLVVDSLGSQHVLLFLAKSFKNVIRADFHDVDFLIEAVSGSLVVCTLLEVSDLTLASARDLLVL